MADRRKVKRNRPNFQEIIDLQDDKINVLMLGISGCGKSTLVNAILEANEAPTGVGTAVTQEIKVYQNDNVPFRMIDTVGYEYGFLKQGQIKRDLAKFSKEGVKSKDVEKLIHLIWFCIDGTSKRIDLNALGYMKTITADWKNVPLIIVLTKSYSEKEIDENIKMVRDRVNDYNAKHKKKIYIKDIIPVVARPYEIDDTKTVEQRGLDVLIARTNELAPEAKRMAKSTVKEIDLKLKGSSAYTVIGAATAAAATVGAVPIPVKDSIVLMPLQGGMLNRLSKAYALDDKDETAKIIETIISAGATTIAGTTLLNLLKRIPVIGSAASVLNAVVAGAITFMAGQVATTFFEKIYIGEIDPQKINWDKEVNEVFKNYIPGIVDVIRNITKDKDSINVKEVFDALIRHFFSEEGK